MPLSTNKVHSMKDFVQSVFLASENERERLLSEIGKLVKSDDLQERIQQHLRQQDDLIQDISNRIQKKTGMKYCVKMPAPQDGQRHFKEGVLLCSGDSSNLHIYGYMNPPENIDDSPERINQVIDHDCFKYFNMPKEAFRLTDREIEFIFNDDYPGVAFDDVLSMRVHTIEAVAAFCEKIPSIDRDEAIDHLDAYACDPEFQKPFLEVSYPATVSLPLVINRNREEAYVEDIDPVVLLEATNLSPKEIYRLAVVNTLEQPCLTFLREFPLKQIFNDYFNLDFDSLMVSKGTRFGVYDPVVGMASNFNHVVQKDIKLPLDSFEIRPDVGYNSVRNICRLSDDAYRPSSTKKTKKNQKNSR